MGMSWVCLQSDYLTWIRMVFCFSAFHPCKFNSENKPLTRDRDPKRNKRKGALHAVGYRQLRSIRKRHFLRRKNLTHHHHNPKKCTLLLDDVSKVVFSVCAFPRIIVAFFTNKSVKKPVTAEVIQCTPGHLSTSLITFFWTFATNLNKWKWTSMFYHHWIPLVHSKNLESCLARVGNAWNHVAFAYLPNPSILLSVGSIKSVVKSCFAGISWRSRGTW